MNNVFRFYSNLRTITCATILGCTFVGCGGGGSSDGMVLSGLLTQGKAADHRSLQLRHGENEGIEEVTVCALEQCSVTDGQGQFGFQLDESFAGGDVLFTLRGHGIDDSLVVKLPAGADEVEVHFENDSNNKVKLHHMTVLDDDSSEDDSHEHSGDHSK